MWYYDRVVQCGVGWGGVEGHLLRVKIFNLLPFQHHRQHCSVIRCSKCISHEFNLICSLLKLKISDLLKVYKSARYDIICTGNQIHNVIIIYK